jgi:nucleotide-binding universal stress UspA family protein
MVFKNYIVPIDFSDYSLNGLSLALLFSKQAYANIQMVYVQKKSTDYYPSNRDAEKHYAERKFHEVLEKYTPKLKNDSRLRYIIKSGKIYREIVNQAQSYKDSIIIASTHGASGFEEFFIGSNTYKMISVTSRPVITIRKGKCPQSIKKIVMPIEIRGDSRQKVPFTAELASFFNAEIHILGTHISRSKVTVSRVRGYCRQVANFLQKKARYTSNEVFGDSMSDLVVNYANSVKADLISIMSEQGSGISLILGNNAHLVLNKSEIPVLCNSPRELTISGTFKTFGGYPP